MGDLAVGPTLSYLFAGGVVAVGRFIIWLFGEPRFVRRLDIEGLRALWPAKTPLPRAEVYKQ